MNCHTRLFLFVLLSLLGLPTPIWASLNWNPGQVQVSAAPGTVQIIHVQFSSDRDLYNLRLWISPKLRPYIGTDAKSFTHIKATVPQELTLTISLLRSVAVGELLGKIRLRASDDYERAFDDDRTDESDEREADNRIFLALPVDIIITEPSHAVAAAPTTIALPSSDRIMTDPELQVGQAFVDDELDVIFAPTSDGTTIDAVIQGINGSFLGSIPDLNYFQILVRPTDFNGLRTQIGILEQSPAVVSANFHLIYKPAAFPADPGTDLSYVPALINLPQAWDITTGLSALPDGSQLKIGVIDTVFDFTHADLAANIAFHTQNNAPLSASQHGTRVASIIGAVANNDTGIAGVMWNSSLYLYSAGNTIGSNDGALLVQRIAEAINDKVRVVNWSTGGGCLKCKAKDLSAIAEAQKQYLQLFGANGKDILWVMSAGNDGASLQHSTAGVANTLSNVVAVSAVDSSGALASFSDYGAGVIAAPGVEVYSDIPGGGYDNGTFCVLGICLDTGHASGTSFAAPHVVGVAGLMLSRNPNLSPSQIKNLLLQSARDTHKQDPASNEVILLDAFASVSAATTPALSQISFSRTDFDTGSWSPSVAVGDFNNDGIPDLAVLNEIGTVSIFLGLGDGTFGQHHEFSVGSGQQPLSIAAADFNLDGKLDLVTANLSSGKVSILLGNGDGTFGAPTQFIAGPSPWSVIVGDFNLDGKPDLAIGSATYPNGSIYILLGRGDGTFSPPATYVSGIEPLKLVTADFNRDGIPDIAVANDSPSSSASLSVFLGKGDGTFGPRMDFDGGFNPTDIATGDFNGDGIHDLIIKNPTYVSVLLGTGSGTFPKRVQVPIANLSCDCSGGLAVGDFNGDGKLDLAIGGVGPALSMISILLGNGDGTFTSAASFETAPGGFSLAVSDFNFDGKLDLVTAAVGNSPTNRPASGSIHLNTSK